MPAEPSRSEGRSSHEDLEGILDARQQRLDLVGRLRIGDLQHDLDLHDRLAVLLAAIGHADHHVLHVEEGDGALALAAASAAAVCSGEGFFRKNQPPPPAAASSMTPPMIMKSFFALRRLFAGSAFFLFLLGLLCHRHAPRAAGPRSAAHRGTFPITVNASLRAAEFAGRFLPPCSLCRVPHPRKIDLYLMISITCMG
jgi:hypothetical protein